MINKVFITGANGFIGSYICKELIDRGIDFLGMVGPGANNLIDGGNYVECALNNKKKLHKIISDFKPTAVLHLAAIANPTFGDVTQIYDVNVTGSENLLNTIASICSRDTRVVLVSTAGVYGNQDIPFLKENCPYNPVNHYAYSKMVMEILSKNYEDKLNICIVRPFNMIGYGQQDNFLIPKLVKAFVNKQTVLKLGNLETERDYVDANFAANVFVELILKEQLEYNVYNICSGNGLKGSDILDILFRITNYMPEIQISYEFVRKNEIWRMVGDTSRVSKLIGKTIKPKKIEEILTEMVEKYKNEKFI